MPETEKNSDVAVGNFAELTAAVDCFFPIFIIITSVIECVFT